MPANITVANPGYKTLLDEIKVQGNETWVAPIELEKEAALSVMLVF